MSEASHQPRWSRKRVVVGALVVLAVLAAAVTWAVTYITNNEVRDATAASSAAVEGTWKAPGSTGQIHLGADGRFTATALHDELFDLPPSQNGATSTSGTWTLNAIGEYVALVPAGQVPSPEQDTGLGVVETNHTLELCVLSSSPGVLCDLVLQRVPG